MLTDLWYVLYFVVKNPRANHQFVIDRCREVEDGPDDYTLDIWAREHFKSDIITISETLQYVARHPERTNAIYSYARPAAKKFLNKLKVIMENEAEYLNQLFPHIFWAEPMKQAPTWSLDEGLVVMRKSSRKEPTIAAYGLTEGMPTGNHDDRRIYDDITTEDIGESVLVMEQVKSRFDSSQNLGTDGGTHRVVGTYYHYNDPLVYVRDKISPVTKEKPYLLRLHTATEDGTPNGTPVLLSQKRLDQLRATKTFNCQQLLDPSPESSRPIPSVLLKDISPEFIPGDIVKFLLVDSAGSAGEKSHGDSWAAMCIGVEPRTDDFGACNVYILDAFIDKIKESMGPQMVVEMYLRNGFIRLIGVEKSSQSTTEVHIANALEKHGRKVSVDMKNLIILTPASRRKDTRITNALAWPLYNGKVHISTFVPPAFRARLRQEMDEFPFGKHDDGIDVLSYLWDMLGDESVKQMIRYAGQPKLTTQDLDRLSRSNVRGSERTSSWQRA
jgi:phage terminase large subunit-like protein